MNRNKVPAILLLLLALIILIGLFVGYGELWIAVDTAAIVLCGWAGIILFFQK